MIYCDEHQDIIYKKTVSGASQKINLSSAMLDTDTGVYIPSFPGVVSHWDSDLFDGRIPGAGGSSQFGRGGDFLELSDGLSPDGPGGGGGGGAKHMYTWHHGGPGGSAYIGIGY